MKTSMTLLALGAAAALAQDLNGLPDCGKTCISNMLGIGASFPGCQAGDTVCFCKEPNFGYGIRDCSNEACPNKEDAAKVISYGNDICTAALSSAAASITGASATGAVGVLTSALASATEAASNGGGGATPTGSGAGGAGGGNSPTPVSTVPLVATVVSGSETQLQTTGFSTVYSSGGAGGNSESAASTAASEASAISGSVASAASSAVNSVASSLKSAASSAGGAATSAGGSASHTGGAASSPSAGGAAKMTGLPMVGAAGMAALLLF